MDLKEAREEINRIDTEMAGLFIRRMEAARDIAAYKRAHGLPVEDRQQEQRVIDAHAKLIGDETLRPYYIRFLQNTMDVSKLWQHRLLSDD